MYDECDDVFSDVLLLLNPQQLLLHLLLLSKAADKKIFSYVSATTVRYPD
jgi:hypothetical protein